MAWGVWEFLLVNAKKKHFILLTNWSNPEEKKIIEVTYGFVTTNIIYTMQACNTWVFSQVDAIASSVIHFKFKLCFWYSLHETDNLSLVPNEDVLYVCHTIHYCSFFLFFFVLFWYTFFLSEIFVYIVTSNDGIANMHIVTHVSISWKLLANSGTSDVKCKERP